MGRVDYRRAVRTLVWHWNPNCENWPTKAYEVSKEPPANGHKCKECPAA